MQNLREGKYKMNAKTYFLNKLKTRYFSLIIAGLLSIIMVRAGEASTVQFSLAHNATSNVFQSYQPLADQLTAANLNFSTDSETIALYGSLDLNYLYKYSGLSSAAARLGADYLIPAGSKSAFYLALEGEGVLFRNLYEYFNHASLRFLANFKSYLSPSTILRLDSQSQLRKYQYSIFDFFSENLSLSLDHYFSSRTTIKAEAGYGYKLYFSPGQITVTEGATTLFQTAAVVGLQALGPIDGQSPVRNQAGQGGPGGGHGNPGNNYEMGGGFSIRGIPYQTVYYSGHQSIQVFTVSGLIAQGLGDRLGLSFGASKQWNLSGNNPFASSDEFFMVENPTYDQFSWQGYSFRAKLTAEITDKLHGEVQYDYFSREFPGIISLDLDGNSLGIIRKDSRNQVSARIQLDLNRVSFFVNYTYIKNASNDPWFTWNGNVISGGLVWNLKVSGSK